MVITKYRTRLLPQVPVQQQADFSNLRFQRNNTRIFIISAFLVFEQLFYGIFISSKENPLQGVYFLCAFIMLLMAFFSGRFILQKPRHIGRLHKIYELSIGIIGMSVALIRLLFFEFNTLRIPTIYIAVLYGVAVLFYISYSQGFILYTVLSLAIFQLIPHYHPGALTPHFIADIGSNGIIAWIVSSMNYRNFVRMFLDRKEIEKKNEELQECSIRDVLTGLFNRRRINNVLAEVHAQADRYGADFSVIILDIDHFKIINDTHGHQIGDQVLKEISSILSKNIRNVDTCGRWGGEEFLVICPEANISHAAQIAERLRSLIEKHEYRHQKKVSASFGVASYKESSTIDAQLKIADMRLYEAKISGRNRVDSKTEFSFT